MELETMATGTVVDVVMPQMGVSVSEGTVSQWLKQVGDSIERDETILEISTDKVDTEVPSPADGIVTAIFVEEGDTVDVGVKLAEITVGGEAGGAAEAAPVTPAAPAQAAPAAPAPVQVAPAPAAPAPAVASVQTPVPNGNGNGNGHATAPGAGTPGRFVSPVVSRIAAEHGIDVSVVPGTGGGGRVTKKDIMAFHPGWRRCDRDCGDGCARQCALWPRQPQWLPPPLLPLPLRRQQWLPRWQRQRLPLPATRRSSTSHPCARRSPGT